MTHDPRHARLTLTPGRTNPDHLIALSSFVRYPSYPATHRFSVMYYTRRVIILMALVSGVVLLCQEFSMRPFTDFVLPVGLPLIVTLYTAWGIESLFERRKRHHALTVWEAYPDYALACLATFHVRHISGSKALKRVQRQRLVLIIAAPAIQAFMWYSLANVARRGVRFYGEDIAILLCFAVCAVLSIVTVITVFTYGRGDIQTRAFNSERAHLKSISPDLFTREKLEGAISLPGDDSELVGALSQS